MLWSTLMYALASTPASTPYPPLTLDGNRILMNGDKARWGQVRPLLLANPGSKRLAQSARRRTTVANLVPLAFAPLVSLGLVAALDSGNAPSGYTLMSAGLIGMSATMIPLSIGANRQWKRAVGAYESDERPMDSVQAYIDHRSRGLALCRGDATGRVEIEVAIRKGQLDAPSVLSDNTGTPGVATCMLERMHSWTIPSHLTGVGVATVIMR